MAERTATKSFPYPIRTDAASDVDIANLAVAFDAEIAAQRGARRDLLRNRPSLLMYNSGGSQSIPANVTTNVLLPLIYEGTNQSGLADIGNNRAIVNAASGPGVYWISAQLWVGSDTGTSWDVSIMKNGVLLARQKRHWYTDFVQAGILAYLVVGDVISVQCLRAATGIGTAISANFFMGKLIGA